MSCSENAHDRRLFVASSIDGRSGLIRRPGSQGRRLRLRRLPHRGIWPRDHKLRPLPAWSGCRRLGSNDLFLLMGHIPDSFDGRYFGVTPRTSLIGKLVPLWTK
ncbi:MAG TPA: S26 family signal peptidase [Rhizomicrobium sp.]